MMILFPDMNVIFGVSDFYDQINAKFINKEQKFLINDAIVFVCQFNQSLYHEKLFKQLRVNCPDEIRHAVLSRKAEFLAGRYAASQCMHTCCGLTKSTLQVGIGKNRCPIWPDGILGTISHCNDIVACAVLPTTKDIRRYIGIDIEKVIENNIVYEISSSVCSAWEWQRLMSLPFSNNIITTIIFSIKECLFKALYPYIGEYFGFECAQVKRVDPYKQLIWLNLSPFLVAKSGLQEVECYYTLQSDYVITFIYR